MNTVVFRYLVYQPILAIRGVRFNSLAADYIDSQYFEQHDLELSQNLKLRQLLSHCRDHSLLRDTRLNALATLDLKTEDLLSVAPIMNRHNYWDIVTRRQYSWQKVLLPSATSSGTTGKSFTVLKNPSAWGRELAASWRAYSWFGVKVGDPQARFWGLPLSTRGRLHARMTDLLCNRVRHPATKLDPIDFEHFAQKLLTHKPLYYYGIPSLIDRFARWLLEKNIELPATKGIVTTGETLRANQRESIERAFRARVFDEYGCSETGPIANQCLAGRYHVSAENIVVRIVRNNMLCAPGQEGKILITCLNNTTMPLINYDTGDIGALASSNCDCGIKLPVLERVEGREMDYLESLNGNEISPVFIYYLFAQRFVVEDGVREWQLIQYGDRSVLLIIVPGPAWSESIANRIRGRIFDHMGKINLVIQTVDTIPSRPSGKVQQVVRLNHDAIDNS